MNTNDFLKKNLTSILSIIAIIAMFLTLISFSVESEYMDNTQSLTGIQSFEHSIFGYLLIIGPIILIAMNYINQLGKYKNILSLSIPCACILALIIVFFQARTGLLAGAGLGASMAEGLGVDVDYKVSIGIGTILAAVSYIAMAFFAFKENKHFKLSTPNMGNLMSNVEGLKSSGTDLMKNAKTNIANASQNISETIQKTSNHSQKHIDETLSTIEKLAKMRDNGILTEEEFTEKKKELLEEM